MTTQLSMIERAARALVLEARQNHLPVLVPGSPKLYVLAVLKAIRNGDESVAAISEPFSELGVDHGALWSFWVSMIDHLISTAEKE